ncbi:DUF3078 domain-containing protein [Pedobacter sp. HMF7647]|uniref:DUF3078 domain-containing protein n=1 Tax=Hufsiella arboris TaxID=2695275 RepID=A0A7K1YDU3_9SPHI|nr:DUF3078 domain-containing protein [Hufsiella arboris]MXV52752.1 DUF3078 domain-containing protein [Hufsiella arboris]
MKKYLLIILSVFALKAFSQEIQDGKVNTESKRFLKERDTTKKQEGWTVRGNNTLLLNQAAFSNWISGGINSIALAGRADQEFNLKRGRNIWDNRFILAYGLRSEEGDRSKKVEDLIDITSKYGYEIGSNWYAAVGMNFKTQFTKGYDYTNDNLNYISNFMAPGYLAIGLGFDYIPNDNFQLNIHPLTSRMTFITDDNVFDPDRDGIPKEAYGADPFDHFVYQFGLFLGARYKAKLMDNVTFDNRAGIYSNYLEKPQNMVLSYSAILDLKVNKFISTQITFDAFYDENQVKKVQIKETLGVGLTYKYGKY